MNSIYCYKIKISYKGTRFLGWQIQEAQGATIQGEINKALFQLCKSYAIRTLGASRTDAGVHALGQVFKADLNIEIPPDALIRGLNSLLNGDIRVLEATRVSESFHPIGSCQWKEYHYLFTNREIHSPFGHELISGFTYKFDLDQMKKAAKLFIGKHDFKYFQCVGSETSSTIRTIHECDVEYVKNSGIDGVCLGDYYRLRVRGSGFLKQMVRLMMGAIWNVGRGKISLDSIRMALQGEGDGNKLGAVAPPQGLYLMEIHYPEASGQTV